MNEQPILRPDRHFYTMPELLSSGLTYYKIGKLVAAGELIKLNNKVYENASFAGEDSDFALTSVFAPKSVVCMMSAARYYGLTNYLPDGVDVAIARSMKISSLPEWPPMNVWFFAEKRYDLGQVDRTENDIHFRIYDIEKTVIDILYYRNRVGIEEVKEILKNYLARDDRDLIKLHRYADALGCKKILGTYMEVLL